MKAPATTSHYMHVLEEKVADAMEQAMHRTVVSVFKDKCPNLRDTVS